MFSGRLSVCPLTSVARDASATSLYLVTGVSQQLEHVSGTPFCETLENTVLRVELRRTAAVVFVLRV